MSDPRMVTPQFKFQAVTARPDIAPDRSLYIDEEDKIWQYVGGRWIWIGYAENVPEPPGEWA